MNEISITNLSKLENKIKKVMNKKTNQLVRDLEEFLINVNELLGNRFAESKEFNEIKTSLRGEFGFTSEEVAELDEIINVIKNDKSITRIRANSNRIILEWVDFEALKKHPAALHPLSKKQKGSNKFDVSDVVSWVDWLENGLSITGYVYKEEGKKASRSESGVMRRSSQTFRLRKTKVLEKLAKTITKTKIKAGIAVIIEKRVEE